jgi:hypothetical protein
MSKHELPADVTDKVLGMPKARPFGVFIFQRTSSTTDDAVFNVKIMEKSLTSVEIEGLLFPDPACSPFIRGKFCYRYRQLNDMNLLDDYVYAALSIEFNFRTEADRQRWQNKESFEMYRAHGSAIV